MRRAPIDARCRRGLAAMALGSAARADVRTINLDGCSGELPCARRPMTRRPPRATRRPRSRSPGPAAEPLIRTSPVPLLCSTEGRRRRSWRTDCRRRSQRRTPSWAGSRPYDYFEDVIDIPLSAEARADFAAVSFFLFAPSLLGRLTLTDVLSAGTRLFRQILAASAAAADVAREGAYMLRDVWRGWNWPIPGAPTTWPSSTTSAPRSSVLTGHPVTSMPS